MERGKYTKNPGVPFWQGAGIAYGVWHGILRGFRKRFSANIQGGSLGGVVMIFHFYPPFSCFPSKMIPP